MTRKNKPFLFLLLLATALLLGGCNTLPKQDFNVKANTHLKKIGVIVDADTEKYSVVLLHHPGVSFGLIGGLVAAAEMSSKGTSFTAAVKLSKQQVLNELRQALRGLEQGGRYNIEFLQVADTEPTKLLENYADLSPGVDAYLDIRLTSLGYTAQHLNTPYVPEVVAKTKMIDARNKQLLYEATLAYGETWRQTEGLVQVTNKELYSFLDFDHLVRDVDKAREGLLDGTRSIGQRINLDLR